MKKTMYIVTFKDGEEMANCPRSMLDRLAAMADKVCFVGRFGPLPADDLSGENETLYAAATEINRAIRGDKDILVFGCLKADVDRITALLDTRFCKVMKFTFAQVKLFVGSN